MDDKIKILILEDVPLDAALVEMELKRADIDFKCIRVEKEDEYVQALQEYQPDIILADHSLPQFDGVTAMHLANEHVPQTPFIFVSGKIGEEFAIEMLKEGATDYVIKTNLSKLPHAVKRALDESKKRAEKEKFEQALKESEEKYRSLFEFSPDYIVIVDPKGILLDMNRAAEEFSGHGREEFIGKSFSKITNDLKIHEERYKNIFAQQRQGNEPQSFEMEVEREDGKRYIEIHHVPLTKKGKMFGTQIIGRDITGRKNAELKVLRSKKELTGLNNYLEAIIFASPFAIMDLDPEGHIKSVWNPAAERIFGWSMDEVIGNPLPSVPDDKKEEEADLRRRILSGETINEIELKRVRKDGDFINIILGAAPIYNTQGGVSGVLATSADISDMVKAEEQIKASLKEKEILLREVHHRVKNNLQIISSLMSLQADYTEDQNTLKIFQESRNRVRAMALIHEKLYLSHDLAHIDFGEYIQNLADQLIEFYDIKRGQVKLNVETDEILMSIDAAIPLGLIVNELVSNCLKHAFPDDREGNISIKLHSQEQKNILQVIDDGVGIPEDIDIMNTDSLGLQIVQTLTLQLRGEIEVKDEVGTHFEITFDQV